MTPPVTHPLLDEEVEKKVARAITVADRQLTDRVPIDAFDPPQQQHLVNQRLPLAHAALTAVVEHLEGRQDECPDCESNPGGCSFCLDGRENEPCRACKNTMVCPTCNGTGKVEGEGRATALLSGDALGSEDEG